MRFDYDDYNRLRLSEAKGAVLGRGHVHPARLLADNATRLFNDSSGADRSRRSGGLAQSCSPSTRERHSTYAGQRAVVPTV